MFNICWRITENLSAVTFQCAPCFFYPLQQTLNGESYGTRKMLKAIANKTKISTFKCALVTNSPPLSPP